MTVLYSSGRCDRCFSLVNIKRRHLRQAPCPKCGDMVQLVSLSAELILCPLCDSVGPSGGVHEHSTEHGAICAKCWDWTDAHKFVCPRCRQTKRVPEKGEVCDTCQQDLLTVEAECPSCGEHRKLSRKHPGSGEAVCSTCADRACDPVAPCVCCGKRKRLTNKHPYDSVLGRVCSRCYKRLKSPFGACPTCGVDALLQYMRDGQRICSPCKEGRKRNGIIKARERYPREGICAECGLVRRLERSHPQKPGGICARCRKQRSATQGICAHCNQQRVLMQNNPDGPGRICRGCCNKQRTLRQTLDVARR